MDLSELRSLLSPDIEPAEELALGDDPGDMGDNSSDEEEMEMGDNLSGAEEMETGDNPSDAEDIYTQLFQLMDWPESDEIFEQRLGDHPGDMGDNSSDEEEMEMGDNSSDDEEREMGDNLSDAEEMETGDDPSDAEDIYTQLFQLLEGPESNEISEQRLKTLASENEYFRARYLNNFESALEDKLAAVAAMPDGHPDLADHQQGLGRSYTVRFERLGNLEDLECALKHKQAAVAATPDGHPDLALHLQSLGECYNVCFRRLGNLDDLDLAVSFTDRFQRLGNLDDLESGLKHKEAAVAATPNGHPDLAFYQQGLAVCYSLRFQRLGNLDDLESALKYKQAVVAATPDDDPNLAPRQQSLALSYSDRFQRLGNLDDLESALKYDLAAVAATPDGCPNLAHHQQSLAVSYTDQFERLGNLDALESALKHNLAAVAATPDDHPDLAFRQQSLSTSYIHRFQKLGDLNDLDSALEYGIKAVATTPDGHPDLAVRQHSLATFYTAQFERLGNLDDLQSALKYNKAAVAVTPDGHPYMVPRQHSLALSYTHLFQRLGNLDDLESALKYDLAVVAATPDGHPDLARYQNSLAMSYNVRYERLGNLNDLESALKYNLAAVAATPDDHPNLTHFRQSLAVSYICQFQRLGILQEIESLMQSIVAADVATHNDNSDLDPHQQHLPVSYSDQFQRLGKLDDIESVLKQNEAATPDGHSNPALHQHTLAMFYHVRFKILGNLKDLESALKYNLAAVAATPPHHPGLAACQQSLALSYTFKFQELGSSDDLNSALHNFHVATQCQTANPQVLITSAKQWATLAKMNNLPECMDAYSCAISILPDLVWMGNVISARHDALLQHKISQLTSEGAAACIQFGNHELAVELLEQGLAITYQQLLQLRDEFTVLNTKFPHLAQQLKLVSLQLQSSATLTFATLNEISASAIADNHRQLAIKRDRLIREVRNITGFEDFLLPASYKKLCLAAQHGPVVMINCTTARSDALVLLSPDKHIQHVPLFGVSQNIATNLLDKLREALNMCKIPSRQPWKCSGHPVSQSEYTQRTFQNVLTWLETMIVSPVFKVLCANGIYGVRIWWCPSGPLTYLPIHAAAQSSTFVSSYTSTLGALMQANIRQKVPAMGNNTVKMTIVGVPEIPEKPYLRLPSVVSEINKIRSVVGDHRTHTLLGKEATLDNVSSHLTVSPWLHLACHGQQNQAEPLKSGLLLYDGKLELAQILKSSLPNAEFVFLSACQTAMGDTNLVNESMHLAGGLIFAGFHGAIGTLWNIMDSDGPKVAEIVYQQLFANGKSGEVMETAEALHIAVQKLRDGGASFQQWVPFIHMGV